MGQVQVGMAHGCEADVMDDGRKHMMDNDEMTL